MTRDQFDQLREKLALVVPARYREGAMPWVFFVSVAMVLLMFALALVEYYTFGDLASLVFAVVVALLVAAVQYGLPFRRAMQGALATGLVVQGFAAWDSVGVFSPRLAWLMLLPSVPFFFFGFRAALPWLIAPVVMLSALALANGFGFGIHPYKDTPLALTSGWASFALVVVFAMILPLSYHRVNQRTLTELEKQQEELERQQRELERTMAMRDKFIANVSHELRTPMNAILGLNEWLISQVRAESQAHAILKHTRQSADHLMTVINDILDYSALESGTLQLHPEVYDLHVSVRAAHEMLMLKARAQGLNYRCEIDPDVPQWVRFDRHRLVQVLVNLLGNAIKFTASGGVTLHISTQGDHVRFEVQDTGIGIAKEQQPHLFRRFAQANDSIQRSYGGNGLGLAISRRLVELMQGELDFTSELGKGSTFFFTLYGPAQAAPMLAEDASPAPLATMERDWTFLVVDDHAINRLLAQRILCTNWPRSQVLEADNGERALALVQTQHIDAIFMDMRMPVMDGIETTALLRKLPEPLSRMVIVGLTANVNQDDLARFQEAGLDSLILKPFDWRRLCAEVEALLIRRWGLRP